MAALLSFVLPTMGQVTPPGYGTGVTAYGVQVNAVTQYGNVTGRYDRVANVNRFFGIPIAASTASSNRFKKPQPPTPWSTPLDTSVSKSCLFLGPPNGYVAGSEDCLIISVTAPPSDTMMPAFPEVAPPLTYPVAMWIYGGGFDLEETAFWQGNDAFYAGGIAPYPHLPNNGKIVSAFCTYRVATLGAASHPALRGGIAGNQYSGSWMTYDQLNALRWIQINIANFGGDPSKVSIFGQSAGATSTALLTASPLTYAGEYAPNGPLISGAIAHSMWQTSGYGALYAQQPRDAATAAMIVDVGCSNSYDTLNLAETPLTTIATCLRDSDPVDIQGSTFYVKSSTAFDAVYGTNAYSLVSGQSLGVYPCIDGYVFPQAPLDLWKSGYGASVNIVLGHTVDDDGPFYSQTALSISVASQLSSFLLNFGFCFCQFGNPAMNASVTLNAIAQCTYAMPPQPLLNYYSQSGTAFTDPYQLQVRAITDGMFSVGHTTLFDTWAAQTSRTPGSLYKYIYAEYPAAAMNTVPSFGAAHMLDLTFTWGMYKFGKSVMTDNYGTAPGTFQFPAAQIAMGDTMKAYWTNFFVTGSPNLVGDGLPTWSPVTTSEKHTMVFQSTVPGGAILDPCAMFTACYAEPTADYRRPVHTFWTSLFTTAPALPTCSPAVVGPTHAPAYAYTSGCGVTVTPPAAPVSLGGSCSASSTCATGLTCKCVSSRRRDRNLLFGVPSSGSSSSSCYCL